MGDIEEKIILPQKEADSYECTRLRQDDDALSLLNQNQDKHDTSHEDALQRRLNPKTREDFKTLYAEVDIWRRDEYKNSNKTTSESLKLLKLETKLLQMIDSLRRDVRKTRYQQRFDKQVQSLTKSIQWKLSSGDEIEIHRPIMEYSKALYNVYSLLLSCYSGGLEQTLKSLNTVKDALVVIDMESRHTRDLVDVIDRQLYFLSRGRAISTELKNRTVHLFVYYMEDELGMKRKNKRRAQA